MCRWLAYKGSSIRLSEFIVSPEHSLVNQSRNAQMYYDKNGILMQINGDGYGVGWYSDLEEPCVIKGQDPIWNNQNISNLCCHIKSKLFMAHVRLTTTGAVHRDNSHPFSYKNWIFQHNGEIGEFHKVRRDLQMDIDPDLYPEIKGTTDSETIFYLALTYGLEDEPKAAIEQVIRRIKKAAVDRGTNGALNLSCAMSDGKNLYTFRYGENVANVHSQFYSTDAQCLGDFMDDCVSLPETSTIIVSEPLDELSEKWIEIPTSSFVTVPDKIEKISISPLSI